MSRHQVCLGAPQMCSSPGAAQAPSTPGFPASAATWGTGISPFPEFSAYSKPVAKEGRMWLLPGETLHLCLEVWFSKMCKPVQMFSCRREKTLSALQGCLPPLSIKCSSLCPLQCGPCAEPSLRDSSAPGNISLEWIGLSRLWRVIPSWSHVPPIQAAKPRSSRHLLALKMEQCQL